MSRAANAIACCALAAYFVSCAATSGSPEASEPTVVRFSYEGVAPETVHIAKDGNVTWVNDVADSSAFVVFPASIASDFTCGEQLDPFFHRVEAGYQSVPIMPLESDTVELPCPLKPGSYTYEIWITSAGFGQSEAEGPEQKLRGRIIVE